jgi:hypothetical protein
MAEEHPDPYRLGMDFPVLPIPPDPTQCIAVDAGPVSLVVESRDLVDDAKRLRPEGEDVDVDSLQFNDYGASLHVVGRDDGVEHLRFDCFADLPHYHYIAAAEGRNTICRLDEFAEGDPIAWTVDRLRTRLPDMLRYAGATELADAVEGSSTPLGDAAAQVEQLLREAHTRAIARRSGSSAAAT